MTEEKIQAELLLKELELRGIKMDEEQKKVLSYMNDNNITRFEVKEAIKILE